MERAGGPAGELFSDIMNFTLKTQFENYGLAGGPVHDATCIGYLINPDGIKTQEMYVEVDVNSGPCYGRTVCDELGVLGKPANTKVGITIDTDWFWGLVEARIADCDRLKKAAKFARYSFANCRCAHCIHL